MKLTQIKSEDATEYNVDSCSNNEDDIIKQALNITDSRMRKVGAEMNNRKIVEAHLRIKFTTIECEVFSVLFLDKKNRLIELKELFRGTIDGASVYPREVVKEALAINAAAVIFAHNHPSGNAEPSHADKQITQRLKSALELIDIHVLDHIIVGDGYCVSFADRGLI